MRSDSGALIRAVVGETGVEETPTILRSALPRLRSQGITLGLENHFDLTMDQLLGIVGQLGDERAAGAPNLRSIILEMTVKRNETALVEAVIHREREAVLESRDYLLQELSEVLSSKCNP